MAATNVVNTSKVTAVNFDAGDVVVKSLCICAFLLAALD
jgi:hypothetical protein